MTDAPRGSETGPDAPGSAPAGSPPETHASLRARAGQGLRVVGKRLWPGWVRRLVGSALAVLGLWVLSAYLLLPTLWRHYEHQPGLARTPKTTVTADGIPGDALNVGLVGTHERVVRALIESGWEPADPVTLRSSLGIVSSVLRDKPYPEAPVSPLYVFGRKQDLAFEKPIGRSASRRHHVRFWQVPGVEHHGTPLWVGAITLDRSVGLSHRTGQVTHHIAPDIDTERDLLMRELAEQGWLQELFQVTGVGATLLGRNGGGDPYYTDGELSIGVLAHEPEHGQRPTTLANPTAVRLKQQFWTALRPLLQALPDSD